MTRSLPSVETQQDVSTPVEVVVRGSVSSRARSMLRDGLARLAASSPRPIAYARGTIRRDGAGSQAHADGVVAVGRRVTRASASGRTPIDAIEVMIRKLHQELHELGRRETSTRRRAVGH
jgi:hypothetical protein